MKQSFIWTSSIRWWRRAWEPISLRKGDTEELYQREWEGWVAGFQCQGNIDSDKYMIYCLTSEAVANRDTAVWRVFFTWWGMAFWCCFIAMRSDAWSPSLTPQAMHYGNNDALSSPQVSGKMYSYGPNKIRGRKMMADSPEVQSCPGPGWLQGCWLDFLEAPCWSELWGNADSPYCLSCLRVSEPTGALYQALVILDTTITSGLILLTGALTLYSYHTIYFSLHWHLSP